MDIVFTLAGIGGLLLIISGLFIRTRKQQSFLFILGGSLLAVYSYRIGDMIFLVLQFCFIASAMYEFLKLKG